MKRVKKSLNKFPRRDYILFGFIFLIALLLRLYPGKDHFLWVYDHARDAMISRSVIAEKNITYQSASMNLR